MNYPLQMNFKILGIAPQIFVTDANGSSVFYVRQKLFKLKEAVRVYRDKSREDLQYEIKADRILDFSAKYTFTDQNGSTVGAVGRKGMRSLFRATYDIYDGEDKVMVLQEEEVWKRFVEGFLGRIPILGYLIILLINPSYVVRALDGSVLFRLTKKPAFFEGKFSIDRIADSVSSEEEIRALLSMLMLSLLERARG